ncbi:hypothetical protein OESDEN_01145 [Oesophagostomum dentatum]|uniref:Uncharacterized protein n=1 Tax=Oesophagostomum dentatum TaxID=61180 RepID=A0A0B1TRY2_OESDE|nr:hypothetical protein OESDEN_01145 [Oesophagostomum dentatum]
MVSSERKKNGGSHPSVSHLPNQSHSHDNAGTLDARGHRHDKECAEHQKHRTKQKVALPKEQPLEKENVSLSLPNVLSDDIQVVCRELEIESAEPPKSLSGDNFNSIRPDYDNLSEDSYRLSDHERSTKSDVGVPTRPAYSATFNTKRNTSNVVVKRVISQSKSTPQSTDEEDSASTSVASASASTGRRRLKEYPFNSTSFVPIEIDGPNVDISVRRSTGPIYTSTGALLLKPKHAAAHHVTPEDHPVVSMIEQTPPATAREETEPEPEVKPKPPPTRPKLISVKSEDSPNVEKCHLFNSEIPYTLTLRKVDSAESLSFPTFKDRPKEYDTGSLRKLSRSPDQFKRRKSLDLVPRKRLPSPRNFSSQDHSISPTTPEGNVLDYVLRHRSQSHERPEKRGKRGDVRRQTQPVRFDLPPSPCSPVSGSTPFISCLHDDVVDDNKSESRSLHEEMEKLEGVLGMSVVAAEKEQKEDSEGSDSLPPPPETVVKPPPPPPPPKPKGVSEHVAELKTSVIMTSVVKAGPNEKEESSQQPPQTSAPTTSTSQSSAPQSTAPSDSKAFRQQDEQTPFIDESPKSSDETLPVSRRTETGLLWTDF